ncbi:MAG: hypothetical protein VYA57_05540 [Candidatus Thermoplasmatota archaeon]|nr:hypothetical protein [Candidatus Thermoplasmatota archaeon]MEE2648193.1 hypothetical protein [Candidatus Thermoplasmatota archaeon]
MASVKDAFLRLIELSLYGHGVLHFVEVGFAVYEEAYITASIAGFGALTMMLGAIFLRNAHHHGDHRKA